MSDVWKQWEGRTIDDKILLQSYLGESNHSAVFLASWQHGSDSPKKVAVKLLPAREDSQSELSNWEAIRKLDHGNLLRIFHAGRARLDTIDTLYVVEEYAEENLSQILPERALTGEETGGMLASVLEVLQYIHHKGFAHGRVQPSNIMAIADRVKVSSDSLRRSGQPTRWASPYDAPEVAASGVSPEADVWSLGITLLEVLTRHAPAWDTARLEPPAVAPEIPQPFREIALHCLEMDPTKRWTLAEVADCLRGNRSVQDADKSSFARQDAAVLANRQISATTGAAVRRDSASGGARSLSQPPTTAAKWPYIVGLAVLLAGGVYWMGRPKTALAPTTLQSAPTSTATEAEKPSAAVEAPPSSGMAGNKTEKAAAATTPSESLPSKTESGEAASSEIVRRVSPQVLPSARRTIQGTIKVRVRVEVDDAGNVTDAKLESAGPSKYFARISLEAARDWKFAPLVPGALSPREWKLQFAFSRARTSESATRVKR